MTYVFHSERIGWFPFAGASSLGDNLRLFNTYNNHLTTR